jgi:CBS domain-containing protein
VPAQEGFPVTTARDLMLPCPCVTPTTTVAELVSRMVVDPEYFYAVVDETDKLAGIVTEFDLVRLMYESGHYEAPTGVGGHIPAFLGYTPAQLRALTAADVMTNDPETIQPDTPLEELAISLFQNHRKVLMVTEGSKLLGVVRRIDVISTVLG